ncbi:class II aldolase/adducin family protein [Streptomyces sp. NPDC090493]|uniref:class II aldolase/adducin family protein n=1 Tax=Streptomyces sp. NPDC090493 TaxID=3365964 RepID=UPI00382A81B8
MTISNAVREDVRTETDPVRLVHDPLGRLRPPTFHSPEAERQHRKERLAGALRIFGREGYNDGAAGHITVRDPIDPSTFWVNPLGVSFNRVRVSDLLRIDSSGQVIDGNRPVNPAAFCIHAAIHRARPDVMAAAHAHTKYGLAFASLGKPLAPLTQDACAYYGQHAVFEEFGGLVVDSEYADRLARALGPHKALIHRNHGLITVGDSVDAAAWWFIGLDRSCQAQLVAEAAGTPIEIDRANAELTAAQVGRPFIGWLSFQPMWDDIIHDHPDLLD